MQYISLLLLLLLIAPCIVLGQSQVSTEEITFVSRGTELVGTLHLPPGPGPHPIMVGAHGSGHVDRRDLYQNEVARYFAPRGLGFFMFDKRGVGASKGKYRGSYSSSMVTYAVDVLAAVEHVATHPKVDADRIGLWGMSQAGWVIPIAASMEKEKIAFTIIVSGPTVSILEENLYSDLTGQTQGRPTTMSRDEIRRHMAEAESKGLDASVFIAELTMPGLWIYGDLDQSVPWEQGVEDLRAIAAEFDRPFTWNVFAGGNHGLRQARTGGPWERPRPTKPVDGYFAFMADWLRDTVGLPIAQ